MTEVSEPEGSQSGVSRALARLEAEVGTPLLRRYGRTLRTTHAGAVFKRHLNALLHQLDDGIAAVNQLIEPDTGVALTFLHSLGTWLVPDLVRSFRAATPASVSGSPGAGRAARGGAGGRGRRPGDRHPPGPGERVHTRLIAAEPLRLAVPREHQLAKSAARPPGRRGGRALHRPASRHRAAQAHRRPVRGGRIRPEVVFEGDDLSNVRGFVAAGLGVAVVPAPRAGSPESAAGPVTYREIPDPGGPGHLADLGRGNGNCSRRPSCSGSTSSAGRRRRLPPGAIAVVE